MQKKIPQRQCMGCRERKEKREMIRVVRTTEGEVRLDFSGKLNGRGAYICRDAACVEKAVKIRAVQHALGQALSAEQELSIKEALQADE